MHCLKPLTRVILLSLMAGSACTTASDGMQKESVMLKEVNLPSLAAGIELVTGDKIQGVGNSPMVLFHVSNGGELPVSFLTWNTPLEKPLSADVFTVVHDGRVMEYQGRMVKRGAPQEQDFIDVPAGGRVENVVDIGRYYDISKPGFYSLSYKSEPVDGVVDLNQKTPVTMTAQILTFTVSDSLAR